MDQHEIADARRHAQPERRQFVGQPGQPLFVERDRVLDMGPVADRRCARRDRRRIDVEGAADAVHRVDHMRRRVHPADPEAGQAVDLGKGPGHHDVLRRRDELKPGLVVVAPHIFRIGGVENQQHVAGQPGLQPAHLLERQIGAGRVVRIGEEHDARALGHRRQDRVDVGAFVLFLHHHRRRAGGHDLDLVDEEAVLGENPLVAGLQVGLGQKAEQLVGTVRAQYVRGIEPVHFGDRLAQGSRGAVGIEFELLGKSAIGVERRWRGAQRRLVRRQLVDLLRSRRTVLAGHIGGDVHDTGFRFGARSLVHRKGSRG